MTDRSHLDDAARYADAVRAALADLGDEERAALLDDLEAHLAEVAAESDAPLTERLGPPDRYAAELRAAYDPGARREPRGLRALLSRGRPLSRRWRPAYFAVVVLVIVGGATAGLAAWRASAPAHPPASDHWTLEQLVERARTMQLRRVDITGATAIATDRAGARHPVDIGQGGDALAAELTKDSVDVSYRSAGGLNFTWVAVLLVLVPNLFLLLLVAGVAFLLYRALRRPGRSPGVSG